MAQIGQKMMYGLRRRLVMLLIVLFGSLGISRTSSKGMKRRFAQLPWDTIGEEVRKKGWEEKEAE